MKDFVKRLNKKRLKTLAFFALTSLLFVLCAVALVFTVSDDVHLEIWITLVFAAIFAALAVASRVFLLSPARKDYEDDFKSNAMNELFLDAAEDVAFEEGHADVSRFASQNVISGFENDDVEKSFRGKYEGIPFAFYFARRENAFTGWMAEFEFSKTFKRDFQLRRKGSSLCVPPEKVWEDGFAEFETSSEPFNFRYVVVSADGVDVGAVMCEEAVYSFLSATERTRARISASFDGNRLYLFLQGVAPGYNIPLLSPVTETRLKKELFADISAALVLATDLDTEKKIWKRTV